MTPADDGGYSSASSRFREGHLSAGAKGGIAGATVAMSLLILGLLWFMLRKRRAARRGESGVAFFDAVPLDTIKKPSVRAPPPAYKP